jgi:DnaJ-domain-containing protein 1
MIEAYPLQWPTGFSRTRQPKRSQFRDRVWNGGTLKTVLTIARAQDEIYEQLRLLLGKKTWQTLQDNECVISTNMRRRKSDGGIYSNEKKPEDSGVAVYFMYEGQMRVIACDAWLTVKENMHAIAKTIDAMRGIERWGASDMLNRMFTGFIGIPDKTGMSEWWHILGTHPNASPGEIKKAYRVKMKEVHPDVGGSEVLAHQVDKAYREALQQVTS